jgi:hypothetical protein
MNDALLNLRRIAEVEFGQLLVDGELLGEKLRLFVRNGSYIDVWVSQQLAGRFGFHWERQHLDGRLYRYDNFPDPSWRAIATFPAHFHNGAQDQVEAAPISTEVEVGFRECLRFVESKLMAAE